MLALLVWVSADARINPGMTKIGVVDEPSE
jgi:hypothetical protein